MARNLLYNVVNWSSFTTEYHPRHIMDDRPTDQTSRWLSETTKYPQFVTLELSSPAVVEDITFGKFSRPHACNVKKVRVEGGMEEDKMVPLFEGTLQNNTQPECVLLRHHTQDIKFPCRYIRIVPLQSWGQTNFSIWFVALSGDASGYVVKAAMSALKEFREKQAVRVCLKHLRQFDYEEAFSALQKRACVELEHPLLTTLHSQLVEHGDYTAAEETMEQIIDGGFVDTFISSQPVRGCWVQLLGPRGSEFSLWPVMRGGHQLCIDPIHQRLYLFGGWDGSHELADLWLYDIAQQCWTCICQDTSLVGGPCARSCHKMCLDIENQILYVLGRYIDHESREVTVPLSPPGDMYSYCIDSGEWTSLSLDTYADGGPHLIFDHQMCYNPANSAVYVFGGRVQTSGLHECLAPVYSGLYAYFTLDKQWVCLRPDYSDGNYPDLLLPRMAHSMVLDNKHQKLYVMGGQRNKQQLSDLLVYSIQQDNTSLLSDDSNQFVPGAGYTLRATVDPCHGEIVLLQGIHKTAPGAAANDLSANSVWMYKINTGKWINVDIDCTTSSPSPRYAHQFVYDPVRMVHYMYAGNPGRSKIGQIRLDDLWRLSLHQLTRKTLYQQCQYMLRKARYEELTRSDSSGALHYLQTAVSTIIDHSNTQQSQQFRSLVSHLFTSDELTNTRQSREKLFDKLSSYLPDDMTAPKTSLIDLIDY